jgi:plasmid stabilization system protein ParE
MTYELIVRQGAESDIDDSYSWYEDQSIGLGDEFPNAIQTSFQSVLKNPLSYQLIYRNLRRAVTKRFPHSIFYFIESDTIFVTPRIHHRRGPAVWKKRR